jgi:hypothetical protein
MRKMAARLSRAGLHYQMEAILYGQADGTPIRSRLMYKGEYGVVYLPASITTLNGRPHDFFIQPGQRINNRELAALRAYSLGHHLVNCAPDVTADLRYNVKVTPRRGQAYRTGKVIIRIQEK